MRRLMLLLGHAADDAWIRALLCLRGLLSRLLAAALLRQDKRDIASLLEMPKCAKP